MTEKLSVWFKIGRSPGNAKPDPATIEKAISAFMINMLDAKSVGTKLGVPSNLSVQYEVKCVDELTDDKRIPFHLSIRGSKDVVVPWFSKLKSEIEDVLFTKIDRAGLKDILTGLGISSAHPVEFKLYARSHDGQPLGPYPIGPR